MKIKRIISVFIAFSISFCSLSFTDYFMSIGKTSAADDYEFIENGVKYTIYDDLAVVEGYTDDIPENVILPDTINGVPVAGIWEDAFYACDKMKSIYISDNVEYIDTTAFLPKITYGLMGDHIGALEKITVSENNKYFSSEDGVLFNKEKTILICYPFAKSDESYYIPDGIIEIADYAFIGNSLLQYIVFSDSVKRIGQSAFWCCDSLDECDLSNNLEYIGVEAFGNTRDLNKIVIPEKVNTIDRSAFFYTHAHEITILNPECKIESYITDTAGMYYRGIIYGYKNSTAQDYANRNHIKFIDINDKPETITDNGLKYNIYSDHAEVIGYEKNIGSEVSIPSEIRGVPVTEVGKEAFRSAKNIESVMLPDTITRIDDYSFSGTGIHKINIPSNVTEICFGAFEYCVDLNEVSLPESLIYIGEYAFYECKSLLEIRIPKNVELIEYNALNGYGEKKTIYGYIPSEAYTYAENNNLTFILILDDDVSTTTTTNQTTITTTTTTSVQPSEKQNLGDINNDGYINAVDASTVLTYYALISTNKDGGFSSTQKASADVNNDGLINAVDASCILSYYAYISTTKEDIKSLEEFLKK